MSYFRCRFKTKSIDDPRPIKFPPPGPFWITGEGHDYATVVAYISPARVTEFWPDAYDLESQIRDRIEFTDRFPKPDWYDRERP